MNRLFRRLRGMVGMGLTWGVAWAAIFYVIASVVAVVDPPSIDPGEQPAFIAAFGGAFGFISGAIFGLLFSLAEGRRKLLDITPARAAIWGALGAATLPLLSGRFDQVMLFSPIGAAIAAGTVAIARRAERRAELPGAEPLLAVDWGDAVPNAFSQRMTSRDKHEV